MVDGKSIVAGLVVLTILLSPVILLAYCQYDPQKAEDASAQVRAEHQAQERVCRQDLDCYVEPIKLDAMAACRGAVEGLAKYDFEWTSGFAGPSFSNWVWRDRELGTVTFVGDQIKFQNGFGAWQRHQYECDYDPASELVINARAYPLGE